VASNASPRRLTLAPFLQLLHQQMLQQLQQLQLKQQSSWLHSSTNVLELNCFKATKLQMLQ
jgi:hypothetical protein